MSFCSSLSTFFPSIFSARLSHPFSRRSGTRSSSPRAAPGRSSTALGALYGAPVPVPHVGPPCRGVLQARAHLNVCGECRAPVPRLFSGEIGSGRRWSCVCVAFCSVKGVPYMDGESASAAGKTQRVPSGEVKSNLAEIIFPPIGIHSWDIFHLALIFSNWNFVLLGPENRPTPRTSFKKLSPK